MNRRGFLGSLLALTAPAVDKESVGNWLKQRLQRFATMPKTATGARIEYEAQLSRYIGQTPLPELQETLMALRRQMLLESNRWMFSDNQKFKILTGRDDMRPPPSGETFMDAKPWSGLKFERRQPISDE